MRFLDEKALAARGHYVLILFQSVAWTSQYIQRLAINYRLIRYVCERGLVVPFGDALYGADLQSSM